MTDPTGTSTGQQSSTSEATLIFSRSDAYRTLDASFALDCQTALRLGWTYSEHMPHALPAWFSPGGKQYARPPRYSYDLDLVWAAAMELGVFIDVFGRPDKIAVSLNANKPTKVAYQEVVALPRRLAVALCRAICQFVDKQEKPAAALP